MLKSYNEFFTFGIRNRSPIPLRKCDCNGFRVRKNKEDINFFWKRFVDLSSFNEIRNLPMGEDPNESMISKVVDLLKEFIGSRIKFGGQLIKKGDRYVSNDRYPFGKFISIGGMSKDLIEITLKDVSDKFTEGYDDNIHQYRDLDAIYMFLTDQKNNMWRVHWTDINNIFIYSEVNRMYTKEDPYGEEDWE